jgi:hypothetical protein
MSANELMGVVTFAIMLLGFVSGVWWRIEGKINEAKTRADKVADELAAHRLHTAETYATKQGMQEQTSQLLRAIEGVGNRIDGMNERLDRAFESQPPRRSTRAS